MKRTQTTAAALCVTLSLTSCFETAELQKFGQDLGDGFRQIPSSLPSGMPSFGRGGSVEEQIAKFVIVTVLASYQANDRQRSVAQQRVQSSSTAKKSQTQYVAVGVPKKDGGKGKDVMLVNKDTNKPKDNKVYTVENDVKKGKTYNIGGTNATAIDTIQGV